MNKWFNKPFGSKSRLNFHFYYCLIELESINIHNRLEFSAKSPLLRLKYPDLSICKMPAGIMDTLGCGNAPCRCYPQLSTGSGRVTHAGTWTTTILMYMVGTDETGRQPNRTIRPDRLSPPPGPPLRLLSTALKLLSYQKPIFRERACILPEA